MAVIPGRSKEPPFEAFCSNKTESEAFVGIWSLCFVVP